MPRVRSIGGPRQMEDARGRRRLLSVVCVLAAIAVSAGPAWAGRTPALRHVQAGGRPALVPGSGDLGALPATTSLTARVYLAGQDPAGLAVYARAVSQPGNPAYRHFLGPAEVQRRFGPSRSQLRAVTSWLTGAGLRIEATTRHYVAVRGAASNVDAAFGVRLHRYRTAHGTRFAPQSDPSVPGTVSTAVLGIEGLDSPLATPQPLSLPHATSADVQDCSPSFGSNPALDLPQAYGSTPPWGGCGYSGRQLRGAYGIADPRRTGSGSTVAIVIGGEVPTMRADADRIAIEQGARPFAPGQYREDPLCLQDDSCGVSGNVNIEEALDVEAVHAVAPGATIVHVAVTRAATGYLDGLTDVVDRRLADIVSDSWGLKGVNDGDVTADVVAAYEQVFEQGAVEGIGFYFGSGDSGDEAFPAPYGDGRPHVNFPVGDPWVTAVGGTSLAIGPSDDYRFETGWGDREAPLSADSTRWIGLPGKFAEGAGGGASERFGLPFYQRGVVPARLSRVRGGPPMRVVPDIAADADPSTGLRIGLHPLPSGGTSPADERPWTEHVTGGTSLACPLIAGMQAIAQQARGGVPIGFANPLIYVRAGTGVYHDVTDHPLGPDTTIAVASPAGKTGTGPVLWTFGSDSGLQAGPGYDDVTGVGSPSGSRW